MKYLAYLICLFVTLSVTTLSSQSIEKLDQKYGFKDFRFGQSLSSFSNKVEKLYPDGTIYKWTEDKPYELFGWDWTELFLGFHKDKLVYISVSFADDKELYKYLHKSLEGIFGKALVFSSYDLLNSDKRNYSQWDGAKVDMDISHYNQDGDLFTSNSSIILTIRMDNIDAIIDEGDF